MNNGYATRDICLPDPLPTGVTESSIQCPDSPNGHHEPECWEGNTHCHWCGDLELLWRDVR